ncbi:pectinesterase inhibitor 10 [Eurytemora carolleeae]|uniref:pectinesterase inhibitor 10 n=1 Tax=Eurytemora carolleeae TaxID=1294199 RepID=UPI000C762E9D|nr:pectinesterase inhibitor 10 [Eurytemora carolleeae]|eukprot:XP_023329381.1 pectinesterase inhibitor 10-like [Eurytemora affinis]
MSPSPSSQHIPSSPPSRHIPSSPPSRHNASSHPSRNTPCSPPSKTTSFFFLSFPPSKRNHSYQAAPVCQPSGIAGKALTSQTNPCSSPPVSVLNSSLLHGSDEGKPSDSSRVVSRPRCLVDFILRRKPRDLSLK